VQPEAVLRSDALTLMRELRLDHSRFIQRLPESLYSEMISLIKNHPDPCQHKKLAMLELLKTSIVKTRRDGVGGASLNGSWREMVSLQGRDEPFDLLVIDREVIAKQDKKDLETYLLESEDELGSITKTFRDPADWLKVIHPILMSDNSLVIVDRYFDPLKQYYSKLFSSLIDWLKPTRIRHVRIFLGPHTEAIDDSATRTRFAAACGEVAKIMQCQHSGSDVNILMTFNTHLHLRFLGTKACAIELDYGFRLSNNRNYRVSVMRTAGLKDFRAQFFSELKSPGTVINTAVWPPRGQQGSGLASLQTAQDTRPDLLINKAKLFTI